MGAVGALPPTVSESVSASTHPMVFGNFSHISINFHKNDTKNNMNIVIPSQKDNIKHLQFKNPDGALAQESSQGAPLARVSWLNFKEPIDNHFQIQFIKRILNKIAKPINKTYAGIKCMVQRFRTYFA